MNAKFHAEQMEQETADYILAHYTELLQNSERKALRHFHSLIKLEDQRELLNIDSRELVYKSAGWLSTENDVLDLVSLGEDNFKMRIASRILEEHKADVFINYCPQCGSLARTPLSKQCRYCQYDWH